MKYFINKKKETSVQARAILTCFTLLLSLTINAQVRLPRLVSDSMILQRDTKIKIWGWASKGEKVNVKFVGKNYSTVTGDEGKWAVTLPKLKAGGPYDMTISGTNKIILQNILIGDVWLCAGQSNMFHYLDIHKERYMEDIRTANYPQVRQFLVPSATNFSKPNDDLPGGNWKSAVPDDVLRFSVVAYFFARKVYEQYKVPIGIIHASVGGTPIEAWTSEEGLKEFSDLANKIQQNKDTAYVNAQNRRNQQIAKPVVNDKGLSGPVFWYDTAYQPKNWKTINIPGYWEDQGIRSLDGIVWYRREIMVPSTMVGVPSKIYLGRIVDADEVYLNGSKIGNTTYQYPQRVYNIPEGVLKKGKNIIVVRVTNDYGKGGFVPDKPYYLSAGSEKIDLKGEWHYKVGEAFLRDRVLPPYNPPHNQPTSLFNGMIAPLTNFAIKGMVWYQGESNTSQPEKYSRLLPALISDWRKHWRQGEVPFVYAQLPNFMDVDYLPAESNWALLREAQLKTLKVPKTGMAVTIDLGEWNDIHPGNKKPVGERLALAAMNVAYGNPNVYSGPLYKSSKIEGDKIVITFSNTGTGLITSDGEELRHFAIAGEDKKFVWGKAEIKDKTVVVSSEKIANPKYVRYAWADNPDFANLYNEEGLPASPFRTDE